MKLGIIGAMNSEVKRLLELMKISSQKTFAQRSFYKGEICGVPSVLVQSGIGKVNASLAAQILIDTYKVDALINTGIAGSLSSEVHIFDVVISDKLVHHDFDLVPFGNKPGQIPETGRFFAASPQLVECARVSAQKVIDGLKGTDSTPEKESPAKHALAESSAFASEARVHVGTIATGDQFICDASKKQEIAQEFSALCAEMEGAAIAQCAALNNCPFVVVRSISDNSQKEAPIAFEDFEKKATQLLFEVTLGFIQELSKRAGQEG